MTSFMTSLVGIKAQKYAQSEVNKKIKGGVKKTAQTPKVRWLGGCRKEGVDNWNVVFVTVSNFPQSLVNKRLNFL